MILTQATQNKHPLVFHKIFPQLLVTDLRRENHKFGEEFEAKANYLIYSPPAPTKALFQISKYINLVDKFLFYLSSFYAFVNDNKT